MKFTNPSFKKVQKVDVEAGTAEGPAPVKKPCLITMPYSVSAVVPLACDPSQLFYTETVLPATHPGDHGFSLTYQNPISLINSAAHPAGELWYKQKVSYKDCVDKKNVGLKKDGLHYLMITRAVVERNRVYTYKCKVAGCDKKLTTERPTTVAG